MLTALFINTAFGSPEDQFTKEELEINKIIDQTFEALNKEYPKELSPDLTVNRMYREDKKIYFIYTITDKALVFIEHRKTILEKPTLELCSPTQYKAIISLGYSIIIVYNTFDKKDAFRIVIDKDTCAKYW